ncbi:MAG TPA: thymidine phosphorylase [Pirellulales bacterium]|jgi:pyrimidine-nucleoside phosphorylase|nr:thymidine phosphorylase [Pirellulales bacterium]
MNPVAVIMKKRDGHALSTDEIAEFMGGFVRGEVPEYQMSALAMAIFFRGMDPAETAALVDVMLRSGATLQWPAGFGTLVDKHSTGGIGDKTSLVIAPLLACCGLKVPMISGRGLGATGGTLDKLESIPGFRTNLNEKEIHQVVEKVGCVITGATADLVPADKKLYALRDVSGTVPSIPLICASIMSKKMAEGLNALVLDVKWGSGAFMRKQEDARALAQAMVATGERMNVRTTALLTDMNQPHGRMAGNAVEVDESVATLQGKGPNDLLGLCIALSAELLVSTGLEQSPTAAGNRLLELIRSGKALEKFREMVAAQGGNLDAKRPIAPASEVTASRAGCIATMNVEQLGFAIIELGGGRQKLGDKLDFSTGLEMLVRLGDKIEKGQPLVRLFAPPAKAETAKKMVTEAITVSEQPISPSLLIVERIGAN